jgi:hypothetical protein
MSQIDRRTGGERRTAPRYNVNINIEWEAAAGRKQGTVNDISREGCFVLCSGEVEDGDRILLFFPLTDGIKVQFNCEVVNHIYEIGFGVKFIDPSPAQMDFLSKLIESIN